MTRSGIKPTTCRSRSERSNHWAATAATTAVFILILLGHLKIIFKKNKATALTVGFVVFDKIFFNLYSAWKVLILRG